MDDRTLRRINHSEYHSTDRWPCETARARNVSAERLRSALDSLEEAGLVKREIHQEPGRPTATVWSLA